MVSLGEDAGPLPAQQQAISSLACTKVTHENPFPSDAAPAWEQAVDRAWVAQVKIHPR